MRFEHLIEVNAPVVNLELMVPAFTREQLWRGLMLRVQQPQRFPGGPESCDWRETEPGAYARTLVFGPHTLNDVVVTQPHEEMVFIPQAHGETVPIKLTLRIEEPQAGQMVLRFVYEAQAAQSDEERYYNDYRHNAWLHNDRDMMRTLRQWLSDEGL